MLELKNVNKTLGDFSLKDINLKINDNEYFVILGPTGTGKTVILETIAGMYKPDTGDILYNSERINDYYPEERNIGFVYQDYLLFPHLNVKENILFGMKLKNTSKNIMEERLEEITSFMGIKHLLKRYPSTLSGGEQQRVALARAIITSPKVLLLDEPLSALDPRTKEIFLEELKKIHNKIKTTTIHITHDFTEALSLADRICIMREGKVIQVGTPKEIFNNPTSKFVAGFVGMENIYTGELEANEDNKYIKVSKNMISVNSNLSGMVNLGIRPEDIYIIKEKKYLSKDKNIIKGIVSGISQKGALVRVELDMGIPLIILISKQTALDLNLILGEQVFAVFDVQAVHVFK